MPSIDRVKIEGNVNIGFIRQRSQPRREDVGGGGGGDKTILWEWYQKQTW